MSANQPDPHGEFESSIRNALTQAVQSGANPLICFALLDVVKLDLRDKLAQRARQNLRANIVKASFVPNGQ
jgi:hypothetical protein